ncbi:hypothetical protein JZ751_027068 [Albula glossodonta]|uniref:Uncharacterized protein n=1 Tax=Albula glossodonta TaxID=121402 RepID=A0A8T2NNY6_9TELE|nr:hypothetical protein JZ751_027068 [Albula glossodonta]
MKEGVRKEREERMERHREEGGRLKVQCLPYGEGASEQSDCVANGHSSAILVDKGATLRYILGNPLLCAVT